MKAYKLFIPVFGLCAACSQSGDPQGSTEETSTLGETPGSSSVTHGTTQSTAQPMTTGEPDVTTSLSSTSNPTTSSSSSGGALTPEEVCAGAKSHDECVALWPSEGFTCVWGEMVEVEIVNDECVLGLPEAVCAATLAGGGQGCFDFGPSECVPPSGDSYVYFQEIRGSTWLWHQLPGGCIPPTNALGISPWTACPHEEFKDVPEVCYCLCGGLPGGTSTGP